MMPMVTLSSRRISGKTISNLPSARKRHSPVSSMQGNPLTITEEIRVAGDVLPASGVAGFPTPVPPDAAYEEAARQGFPPHFYIEAMDRVGIDYMVVYPSVGLLLWAAPSQSRSRGRLLPGL